MKILITSDTHGSYNSISDFILENANIDLILHAGDNTSDAKSISYETGVDFITVKGNNDSFDFINKEHELIDLKNFRILLTHGHKENVYRTYNNLISLAKKTKSSIVIFGHTHTYYNSYQDGILLLNPGSPTLPRDGNPGFLIMDIDDKIKIKRINL
ncbi:MAG: metallophosphoesterase [Peptoniphilaceae bacterium]|nr:metallophosphoesterase [Peptoniphilaceae bacterium]MDY6019564.1 metallophosphoesterase [Anaerococcus sp.]